MIPATEVIAMMDSRRLRALAMPLLLALPLMAGAGRALAQHDDEEDPPSRVARLAYLTGDVSFSPGGEDDWSDAALNRPLVAGDRLQIGRNGRAELDVGGAEVRVAHDSELHIAQLDDRSTQIEIDSGSVSLHLRALEEGQSYEIDTPTLAFVADHPGDYRVDVPRDGNDGARVVVREGSGIVYGQGDASTPVHARESYEFSDAGLRDVVRGRLPEPDSFDEFARSRDDRFEHVESRRYVSPEVIGADDLDEYGDWSNEPEYGHVWYPRVAAQDWAPYRDGHWAWVDPWGWTWVDEAPWGFAPFHYGRWAYVGSRWGWVPGPLRARPVYSPALVAFVGGGGVNISLSIGGGPAVGWFPLGPRDVYVPSYRHSRNYFNNVNVSNVTVINRTVINNYYDDVHRGGGRNDSFGNNYQYRRMPNAATVVRHEDFVGTRRVANARLRINGDELERAQVRYTSPATPTRESLAVHQNGRPAWQARPPVERRMVTHNAPPPPPPSFESRRALIEQNQGQPLGPAQLRVLAQRQERRNQGGKPNDGVSGAQAPGSAPAQDRPWQQRRNERARQLPESTGAPAPGQDPQVPRQDGRRGYRAVPRGQQSQQDSQSPPPQGNEPAPQAEQPRPGRGQRQDQIPGGTSAPVEPSTRNGGRGRFERRHDGAPQEMPAPRPTEPIAPSQPRADQQERQQQREAQQQQRQQDQQKQRDAQQQRQQDQQKQRDAQQQQRQQDQQKQRDAQQQQRQQEQQQQREAQQQQRQQEQQQQREAQQQQRQQDLQKQREAQQQQRQQEQQQAQQQRQQEQQQRQQQQEQQRRQQAAPPPAQPPAPAPEPSTPDQKARKRKADDSQEPR